MSTVAITTQSSNLPATVSSATPVRSMKCKMHTNSDAHAHTKKTATPQRSTEISYLRREQAIKSSLRFEKYKKSPCVQKTHTHTHNKKKIKTRANMHFFFVGGVSDCHRLGRSVMTTIPITRKQITSAVGPLQFSVFGDLRNFFECIMRSDLLMKIIGFLLISFSTLKRDNAFGV